MPSDCRNATVRVWRTGSHGESEVRGAGVHLGDGRILTCAHVVNDALGLARDARPDASARVHIDFPFSDSSSLLETIVEEWKLDDGGWDAALLRITGPAPRGEDVSVRLLDVEQPRGHQFHVLGFPFGHDDGVEAFGKFRGKTARRWVQLAVEPGYGITEGFSGAPVWDEDAGGCVGIIVGKEGTQAAAALLTPLSAGFMIPTNLLQALSPALGATRAPRAVQAPGVPVLPPYYLPRREHETILRLLLGGLAADAPPPRIQIVGMPGLGKTALAIAIARDESVRQAFPDGVFWVSVGRDADLTAVQARLVADARAAGLPRASETGEADASGMDLSALFRGSRALIVLDDVWSANQLSALMVEEMTAAIVTTRFTRMCPSCRTVSLAALQPNDALRVLAGWAEVDPRDLPDAAKHVAERCGYLPLALSIAGAMARGRSHRWDEILERLAAAQLEKLPASGQPYQYPDIAAALAASEATLSASSREKFRDLAIFPEDTPIPERVLANWWNVPLLDARDIIYDWQDRALVQTVGHDAIQLHDLVQDYVRGALRDELPARHRAFLAAFGMAAGVVPTSRDPYFLDHVAFHLVEAGQPEALHALLSAQDQKVNAWWRIRDDAEQLAGYVADLVRAQQIVGASGTDLPRHMRYALMQASIGSLSGGVPRVLVRQLVKRRVWSLNRAVMFAQRIPNPEQRASTLVDLLAFTPSAMLPQRRQEAIVATDVVDDVRARADLLSTLARTTDGDDEEVQAILFRADRFAAAEHAARVWEALAGRLSETQRADARRRAFARMTAVRAARPPQSAPTVVYMEWRRDRLGMLRACAALTLPSLLPELEAEIVAARDEHGPLPAAVELHEVDDGRLWPRVEGLFPDFSIAVHHLSDEDLKQQVFFLMQVLPLLDDTARRRTIVTALAHEAVERYQFVTWTPLLRPDECPLVVEAIDRASHPSARIDLLAHVIPLMPERDRPALAERLFAMAQTESAALIQRGDKRSRDRLLAEVARVGPWLSRPHQTDLQRMAGIVDVETAALVLGRLVRDMPDEARRVAMHRALHLAAFSPTSDGFVNFVTEAGEHLPADLLVQALRTSQFIGDMASPLFSSREVWPYLSDDERETFIVWAFEILPMLKEYEQRMVMWIDGAKFMERRPHGIAKHARSMREPDERALALAALAAVAPDDLKQELLQDARKALDEVTNAISRADILRGLIDATPSRPAALVEEAVSAAFAIDSSLHRARAVIACLDLVGEGERAGLIARLLESLERDEKPAAGLAVLAAHLPLADIDRLIDRYRRNAEGHGELMPALLARLADLGEAERAVDVLMRKAKDDEANLTGMLKAVVPRLPRHLLDKVMPLVDDAEMSWHRNDLVVLVATRRAELGDIEGAEADVRTLTTDVARVQALTGIARHAPVSIRDRFFDESARLLSTLSQADGWDLGVALGEASALASPACARRILLQLSTLVSGWQRRAAASVLSTCIPTLAKLEGDAAVRAWFDALVDVRTWWP